MNEDVQWQNIAEEFADALQQLDAQKPTASSSTGSRTYKAGIGPFAERDVIEQVVALLSKKPDSEFQAASCEIPYPRMTRKKCDIVLGPAAHPRLAIEAKLHRPSRDNGDSEDTAIKKLISPFDVDRSALTDSWKLSASGFSCPLAVLLWCFDHPDYPLEDALHAFMTMAKEFGPRHGVRLELRHRTRRSNLVHPVMSSVEVLLFQVSRV